MTKRGFVPEKVPYVVQPHPFVWDGKPAGHNGERTCRRCPLPENNRHHNVPDKAQRQRAQGKPDDQQQEIEV